MVGDEKEKISLSIVDNDCSASSGSNKSCCASAATTNEGQGPFRQRLIAASAPAWAHTVRLLKRISPYLAAVIVLSAVLSNIVPAGVIQNALAARAPFYILIGALAGIPIYAGDCSMIALVAPLIGATGAIAPGIAFIIAGSGTSINGIVFMSSVFKRRFIILYIFVVFCIALVVGYLVSILLALGMI